MPSISVTPRRSEERGQANHGWLKTFHTFAFASYHTEQHSQFGSLRVINEDRVEAHTGFGLHPHAEFEIFTYVISGQLEHRDSMGNVEILGRGDLQMTSTGTGIRHSEKTYGEVQTHFLQIWALPNKSRLPPQYYTRHFTDEEKKDNWVRVVAPVTDDGVTDKREAAGPAPVHGTITMFATLLSPNASVSQTFPKSSKSSPRKGYIHFAQTSGYNIGPASGGQIDVAGADGPTTQLKEGDGAYAVAESGAEITVTNTGDSVAEVLLWLID
ncbi:hypothetical protein EUX98_g7032 [Antrodiella citrinella]|uniref:Pirin N-terminal domain-containing protein n=1 Tax=Antrodiella citrinella TaxID=2447956 RepID=A0A4S4MMU7_9APHY|nr:hypothetical protein EUX98_g7032 [Antrodiella citrinella]